MRICAIKRISDKVCRLNCPTGTYLQDILHFVAPGCSGHGAPRQTGYTSSAHKIFGNPFPHAFTPYDHVCKTRQNRPRGQEILQKTVIKRKRNQQKPQDMSPQRLARAPPFGNKYLPALPLEYSQWLSSTTIVGAANEETSELSLDLAFGFAVVLGVPLLVAASPRSRVRRLLTTG